MGVGDIAFGAVSSLKSIDQWIAVLNSNMSGSARAGFKATRVKFNGTSLNVDRAPAGNRLGIQIGEQFLKTAQTLIDFGQGSVVASTEPTHIALQQDNTLRVPFFVLNDQSDGSGRTFYTRDGEFHFGTDALLRNSEGLFVMNNNNGATAPTGAIRVADTINGVLLLNRMGIKISQSPQLELAFSDFGSTIFEETAVSNIAATNFININTTTGDMTFGGNNIGRMIPNSLEGSNASLAQAVPELSLAQKMYSAIAKVVQVNFTNIDTVLNLMR